MNKNYSVQANIGRAKHLVNHHDGQKTHTDGSPFYDVHVFKSKKKRDLFISGLKQQGYQPA